MTDDSPYRPLFVEGEPVKIEYTLTFPELIEAVTEFVETRQSRRLSGDARLVSFRIGNTKYSINKESELQVTLLEET